MSRNPLDIMLARAVPEGHADDRMPVVALRDAYAEACAYADGEAVDGLSVLLPAVGWFLRAPLNANGWEDPAEVTTAIFALQDRARDAEDHAKRQNDALQSALRCADKHEAESQRRITAVQCAHAILAQAFAECSDDLHADAERALAILTEEVLA